MFAIMRMLMIGVLLSLQIKVDAAPGDDCSTDTTVCDPSNNEICSGTTCVCDDGYYENGTFCASRYGEGCTAGNTDQCYFGLYCLSSVSKCLCSDGFYYTNSYCTSTRKLRPTITSIRPSSKSSVTINWNSPPATGYTNSYDIKYTEVGTTDVQISPVSGDVSTHLVTGLKAGTSYTFKVTRSISREGWNQTIIDSLAVKGTLEKINYGEACVSNGTCKNLNTDCYSSSCRCDPGYFWKETNCFINDTLKPVNLQSNSKTYDSVTLTWTSPDAAGYTNIYIITYILEDETPQTHYVNGQNVVTTVPNLDPGTTYSFTVYRSITREGRTQTVPASDPINVTTNGVYSDSCTAVGGSTECGPGLVCVSGTGNMCLCPAGDYFNGSICTSIDALKPTTLISSSTTHTDVLLTWYSSNATGYSNAYAINYNVQNGPVQTYNSVEDTTTATVPNLSPGTTYTFTVVRSVTRYGRTQTLPASDSTSAKTKLDFGYSCNVEASECRVDLTCILDKCLCAGGQYYVDGACLINDALKPVNLQSNTKTYNSVNLTWTSPDAAGYINRYTIIYNIQGGTQQTHYVNGQDTSTTVPNLDPGTIYIFTVYRFIIREGRSQTVPASDPYQVTTDGRYSDSCTAVGDSTECGPGLVCVSGTGNRCLCPAGDYFTGSICTSNAALTPKYLTSSTQTLTEVSLTWTSPVASGYINSYVINYYTQGGSLQTYNVDGQSSAATVPSLKPGTTYTFTVVRSIIRYGRTQTVGSDNLVQSTQKLDYGDVCIGDQCRSIFRCTSGKCLCADGSYFTSVSCVSTRILRPTITSIERSSTSSVTVNWNSPPATGYTNSYVIKYTEVATTDVQISPVSGGVSTHLVTGVKAGTSFTFIVVRSISREGRTQTDIESSVFSWTMEKINYGEACISHGTCKNLNTDCYSSTCRCDPGYFWKDTACLTNANLIPGNVNTEAFSTKHVRVTWIASSYSDVVGYLVELSPPISSENILITGTSAIISFLTPGERYRITVSSRSSYLNRGETAAAGAKYAITKPAKIRGLTPVTSLVAPVAQIHFYKADGRVEFYTVSLIGDGYRMVKTLNNDTFSASFPGVSAGLYYNLTIITNSYDVSSDPFTQRMRVRAEASEAVVGLSVSGVTSRGASLTWKRPVNTKGALYKYGIEVFNSSTCVQRINIECAVCKDSMNIIDAFEIGCMKETVTEITQSNLNNVNYPVPYDLILLPDTLYTVFVAAYNVKGKGTTGKESVMTIQEAPGDPTEFRYGSKTYESVELMWNPPEPRPGVTDYEISVQEWDEDTNRYKSFKDINTLGYYNVSVNVTRLSSYWKYRFEMYARNSRGVSNTVNLPDVTTEESAPTAVENLEHQAVDGVYNQYQLSWRCPPQKDGRNGLIRSATVITSRSTKSVDKNPEIGQHSFDNTDCNWSEKINVTPEFNYTFEIYISNSVKGKSTTIQRYISAGPPSFLASEKPGIQVNSGTETEKSFELLICPTCILDNTNGVIIKSGILVCVKGNCPIRDDNEVKTANSYDTSPNWHTTTGVDFTTWYRATEDDWLKGQEASEKTTFVLGETSCGVPDQNRFCNGPLPVERTYRVWIFACTRVTCSEGYYVEFTLDLDKSLPIWIIAAIVAAVVLVVLAAVIIVVYIKWFRPRSQRQRSTPYVSDTPPNDDTYEEIGDINRLSVIKDGRPEVDSYNTRDNPPRSENTYDQLREYSNQGQHDYGKIKVTQTLFTAM